MLERILQSWSISCSGWLSFLLAQLLYLVVSCRRLIGVERVNLGFGFGGRDLLCSRRVGWPCACRFVDDLCRDVRQHCGRLGFECCDLGPSCREPSRLAFLA